MPRRAAIGVCVLSVLVLGATIAFTAGSFANEAGGLAARSPSPATETFRIAPGQPGYTTAMRFDPDRSYEVEVSGTIKETQYYDSTRERVVDEETLSAYHCLAARFDCSADSQNYIVQDEEGASPSFPISSDRPAFSPNGEYKFVTPGFGNDRLTFKPIPDGLYGPEDAPVVSYSGEGFTFKVTELPSSCPAPRSAGETSRGRPLEGCERIRFRFKIEGLPAIPDEEELPVDLIRMKVRSAGYLETSPDADEFSAHGDVYIETVYEDAHGDDRGFIHLSVDDSNGTPSYVTKPNKPDYRKVLFGGRVKREGELEGDCKSDSPFRAGFVVDSGQRAAFKLAFEECLSKKPIGWRQYSFEQASIKPAN